MRHNSIKNVEMYTLYNVKTFSQRQIVKIDSLCIHAYDTMMVRDNKARKRRRKFIFETILVRAKDLFNECVKAK